MTNRKNSTDLLTIQKKRNKGEVDITFFLNMRK